jgi:flagellar biogenesis protein FliO
MPGTGAAGASYGDLLMTSLVVLGGVCVAAFLIVRFVGRFLAAGRARGTHLLDVVARLPLEPRRSLYVVEVAGKTLLLGTSEMGLSVLSELDAGEVRARLVPRPSFGELVRSAWLRRGAASAGAASTGAASARAASTGAASAGAASRGAASTGAASTGAAWAATASAGGGDRDAGDSAESAPLELHATGSRKRAQPGSSEELQRGRAAAEQGPPGAIDLTAGPRLRAGDEVA